MAGTTMRIKRIKFHYPGFNEVRKAPELVLELEARGENIAAAAEASGGQYFVIVTENKTRVRVIVGTMDGEAKRGEQADRRLTRALSAGRG